MSDAVLTSAPVSPDAILADSVGRDVLLDRCRALELVITQRGRVTPEELAAHRPGGSANSDTSAMGWLSFYGDLRQWLAESAPIQAAAVTRMSSSDSEDLNALLLEKPMFVQCGDQQRGVYPKGDFAIDRIVVLDRVLQWLVPRRVAVEASEKSPASMVALQEMVDLQHRLEREFVWIVTHPGPDVPWDDDGQWEHAPPSWTRAKGGYDLMVLRAAYIEVNYHRTNVIAERTRALAHGGDGISSEDFLGTMATELGVSSAHLAHKWSRGMITAMAFTKWQATERARAQAEADAR